MNLTIKRIARVSLTTIILFIGHTVVFAQDINPGSSIFVFRASGADRAMRQTNSGNKTFGKAAAKATAKAAPRKVIKKTGAAGKKSQAPVPVEDETVPPEDWINENADAAIEERKVSDSEPFLSLTNGFMNSNYRFCASPQFPAAARRAKQKLVQSKVLVTVAKYGGVLNAKVIEDDDSFRAAVYQTLGSMQFRESFFLGQPIRIEGMVSFSQNPANDVVCNTASQDVEIPPAIDGGEVNGKARTCETPEFPSAAKAAGLKTVEAKVQVIIGEDGKVTLAKFIDGNQAFGEAAVKAAQNTVFPRSLIMSKYVKVRGMMTFTQTPDNSIQCKTTKI